MLAEVAETLAYARKAGAAGDVVAVFNCGAASEAAVPAERAKSARHPILGCGYKPFTRDNV